MKRIFAALVLVCLLLTVPMAMAEPLPEEETEPTEEITLFDDEDSAVKVSDGPAEEAPVVEAPVDPLENTTSFRRVEIICVVDQRGEAHITQTLKMNVSGIVNDITFAVPVNAKNREIEGYRAKTTVENNLRYLTVHSKSGFSGEQTFILSFTVGDLVSAGEGSQKLDLPLLAQQKYPIGTVALAVNFPELFASIPVFSGGYYGDLIQDYMTIETTDTAVTATVNKILQDSDSLSMSLTVPEGYFSGRFHRGGGGFLKIAALVLAVLSLVLWWHGIKSAPIHSQARMLPPDGVNPGDLPFLLAGSKADFNLLVSHWATLGYLSFYVNKSGHVILRRSMSMGNERRKFEQRLFDLLFGNGDVCDGASVRYQKVARKAQEVIPRYWNRRIYDRNSTSPALVRGIAHLACGFAAAVSMNAIGPEKAHGLFVFLGLVTGCVLSVLMRNIFSGIYLSNWLKTGIGAACGLLLLIVGGLGEAAIFMAPTVGISVFLSWRTVCGGRPSDYGREILGQTRGFRRAIRTADHTHLLQMFHRDPQYFYKMLPYALAMGVGDSFVDAFDDARLEPCGWYENVRGVPTRADGFYDHYLDALDMLNISIER